MQTLEEHANPVCHYKQYNCLIFSLCCHTRFLRCSRKFRCGHSAPWLPHFQLRLEQGASLNIFLRWSSPFWRAVAPRISFRQRSLQIWEPLAQRFHRVIALDFLGFGFSDKPVRLMASLGHSLFHGGYIFFISSCVCVTFLSGHTSTPYLSRPVWWRPWLLTWASSISGWMLCPTTMETLWPWSCSTGASSHLSCANDH